MNYKIKLACALSLLFNCWGVYTPKKQQRAQKKIDTEIKSQGIKIIDAIERNNTQKLINLVEKNKTNIGEIDSTYGLAYRAFLAFLKNRSNDLFTFIYLLILGAEYSNSTAQAITSLIKKNNDPEFTPKFQPILEALTDFKNGQTQPAKGTALINLIRLSILKGYLPNTKSQLLYTLVGSSYGAYYLPDTTQGEPSQLTLLVDEEEEDEADDPLEELEFPNVPLDIKDEETADWIFVPTQEEMKESFKKLLEEENENPDKWEWIDEK